MSKRTLIIGLILISVGVLMLGATLDLYYITPGEIVRFLIPFFFIVGGLALIVKKRRREKSNDPMLEVNIAPPPPEKPRTASSQQFTRASAQPRPSYASQSRATNQETSRPEQAAQSPNMQMPGKVKYAKQLGDIYVDLSNIAANNVEVSNIIGDTEISAFGAKLDTGLNRLIVSSFVGDIKIQLPKSLAVFVHCSSFVGDIAVAGRASTGFGNAIDWRSDNYDSSETKLYIAVNNFVGDIRINQLPA